MSILNMPYEAPPAARNYLTVSGYDLDRLCLPLIRNLSIDPVWGWKYATALGSWYSLSTESDAHLRARYTRGLK